MVIYMDEKTSTNGVRINKYLSEAGVCSRREADRMVEQGRVCIDGVVAVSGAKVFDGQDVTLDGKNVRKEEEEIYLAFYKPKGIVCTTATEENGEKIKNVVEYINYDKRIYPVGRLDQASEGLLLMTNQGEIMEKILRSRYGHEKEYFVKVDHNITDEFLPPMLVTDDACIKQEDTLLWFNFRPDRARQILSALTNPDFPEFKTDFQVNAWNMFEVNDVTNIHTLFELPRENIYPIGKYFSDLKITQARIAETEKYSHVTYFFNAELSKKFPLCDNYLVESPKVPTYDQTPLMSATDVTRKVKSAINKNYDFILVNYANPDMLGHTGNLKATIESLKGLDKLLEYIVNYSIDNFYKVFILADHGNCDEMLTDNDEIITTHSLSKVPFIITDDNLKLKKSGDLTNVAPTLLDYMDIAIPKEMEDAKSLIIKD